MDYEPSYEELLQRVQELERSLDFHRSENEPDPEQYRHFDCVLMDVQMPIMDGVEATKRIRSSENKFRRIPIIALTAYAMEQDIKAFKDAGMNDFVSKPVEHDELLQVVHRNLVDRPPLQQGQTCGEQNPK